MTSLSRFLEKEVCLQQGKKKSTEIVIHVALSSRRSVMQPSGTKHGIVPS